MVQISKNYNLENFANVLAFADYNKFPKICDYCGEIFEADLDLSLQNWSIPGCYFNVRCPVCNSTYYIVYNDLNEFWYLEFAKSPEDYVPLLEVV